LSQFATVAIARGRLDLGADYRLDLARQPLDLNLTNAFLQVNDLTLHPPGRAVRLLTLENFQITNATLQWVERHVQISSMSISGGAGLVERATNGRPLALTYLTPAAIPGPPSPPPDGPPPNPWRFQLDTFSITNFDLAVKDDSTSPPAELGWNPLALELKNFSTQSNAPFSLELTGHWYTGGAVSAQAHGTWQPWKLTADVDVADLALAPAQPYLSPYLNLVVQSGQLHLHNQIRFDPAATPRFRLTGSAGVTDFAATDTISRQELVQWKDHRVRGIDLTLRPDQISIEEIKFVGARNHLVINSNRQLNVAGLARLPEHTNTPTVMSPGRPALDVFPIHVAAVTLEHNSLQLTDESLPRRFEWSIADINGSLRNIFLPGLQKARVDLQGEVGPHTPFTVAGTLTPDPRNLYADVTLTCTNTDLTAFSPYTEKFLGRPLTRGRLTTALRYQIENRRLTAANFADLAHLTLGARQASPEALQLPIKLAIGLLKDAEGHIRLDVPLSGSLDDPRFNLWRLVGQTLQNLVLKAAAAPFSLLGALVGGGAELQFVEFEPGSFVLRADQTNKLVKLGSALEKRTELTLAIRATYDPQRDVAALGRQKLRQQMASLHHADAAASLTNAVATVEPPAEPADYDRWLRQAYQAAFDTTPEQALGEPVPAPPPKDVPDSGAAAAVSRTRDLQKGARTVQESASAQPGPPPLEVPTATPLPPPTRFSPVQLREEMERRLLNLNPVTPEELQQLTEQRVATVKKFMILDAGISADRILPTTDQPAPSPQSGLARVEFSLD